MRRDSIFYRLFSQSPASLFELLETSPSNASDYRFDSVAVKEPRFEIDGVFLPPDSDPPDIVYFAEIQMQKDEQLYERLFGESLLYFYRNRDRFSDWEAVVIYPSRSIEQTNYRPYRSMINSDQVHRIYLNELGEFSQLPLDVALMVLTTLPESQAPEKARYLLRQAGQIELQSEVRDFIIEMVGRIMSYKFGSLSREEVEAMLEIAFEETRVYRELREAAKAEALQEIRAEEAARLVLMLLPQRLKQELSEETRSRITALSASQLEELAGALLDFEKLGDLMTWLEIHQI
jgi:predicted transposase/invertase (TIGR01784 family)